MTIRPGAEWGREVSAPSPVPEVDDDRSLASSSGPVWVRTGDVRHALGHPARPAPGTPCRELPLDLLDVEVTMRNRRVVRVRAASSVTCGNWFAGPMTVASNSGFLRARNVAPRAHPNDGEMDVLVLAARMPLRERLIARARARTGTHVPHPFIALSRAGSLAVDRAGAGQSLRIDGRRMRGWRRVVVTVLPDATSVLV